MTPRPNTIRRRRAVNTAVINLSATLEWAKALSAPTNEQVAEMERQLNRITRNIHKTRKFTEEFTDDE